MGQVNADAADDEENGHPHGAISQRAQGQIRGALREIMKPPVPFQIAVAKRSGETVIEKNQQNRQTPDLVQKIQPRGFAPGLLQIVHGRRV